MSDINEEIHIKSREGRIFIFQKSDLMDMEDFMIKNMIEDTEDSSEIYINEDYNVIKSIFDSMRTKSLIINNDVNLNLMYYVCDKWCVPIWLIKEIENELNTIKKLQAANKFIDNLTNGIYKCKNCGIGYNKFNNKADSCKFHPICNTIAETNVYACCNKEEPCKVGYHCIDTLDLSILIHRIGELKP